MQGVFAMDVDSGQMTPPGGAGKGPRSHDRGLGGQDPNPKLPRASGYVREALRRVTRAGRWKWSRKYPHRLRVTYHGLRVDREKLLFGDRVFSAAYCEVTQRRDLVIGVRGTHDGYWLSHEAQRHFRDCKVEEMKDA